MDPKIQEQLDAMEVQINKIYVAVEKMRKYFLIITWITIAMVVLPVLGLLIAIPAFLQTYSSTFDGLL